MRAWIPFAALAVVATGCGLQLDAACDTRCKMATSCSLIDPPMEHTACTTACETAVGDASATCQASWADWISCSSTLSCIEMRDLVDMRSCQAEAFAAICDCESDGLFPGVACPSSQS